MQYETMLSRDRCHVEVKVRAAVNAKLAAEFARAAAQVGAANGVDTFLVDVRGVPRVGGLLQTYLFTRQFPKLGFGDHALLAILADPGDAPPRFMQTVANSQGLHCQVFDDYAAARDWLRWGHVHARLTRRQAAP